MIDIDDLLGIRYKHNGRTKDGFDCYGLAIEVEKRFGHILPDMNEFKARDRDFEVCEGLAVDRVIGKVKRVQEPLNEGDVILFNNGKILNHIGVYLGDGKYIHCNKFGVHIERTANCFNIGRVYTWL